MDEMSLKTANSASLPTADSGTPPKLIDLFCGAGGLTLGFVQAGFRPVFAIDDDRHAAETYRLNFGDHIICGDIRQIESFPAADVVIGGPPCQGFSRLGKQTHGLPTEKSYEGNGLWAEYMRCVEQAQPKLFVVENVPDFFKHFAWEGIQREAARLGYQLAHAVLHAADFGVPQKRQRAIIIGSRVGKPRLPMPTHQQKLNLLGQPVWRTVRDAIGDLPLEPNNINRHDFRNASELSIRRYKAIPPGGNRKNIPDEIQLPCWKNKNPKSGGSADLMGRLLWDQPALTIRTEFLKPEKGRYLHPQAHRSITVREGARLQTFPDDFKFAGSNYQAAKQIGNAVPVLLARRIAETVLALMFETDVMTARSAA
ncbi:DNA cytosine methyltransferase [Azospirillum sp. B510]|uniref:DNA cytosine methyltransferase n=1 Tax=Azospirillum sp. (strain B510) TaxID=137722 RepID=UPI0011D09C86|nr:DNA cytosine methyltransferase [Azospirillum sp. B510]